MHSDEITVKWSIESKLANVEVTVSFTLAIPLEINLNMLYH